MAERKSQNKWYPPNWDPAFGSLNKFVKKNSILSSMPHGNVKHRVAEQLPYLGKKVRFELPFSVWCEVCKNHIGMGVRYNAHKKHIGNYLSTPIYRFSMKCHQCPNYLVIDTDPKNTEYKIVMGCVKREESYDPTSIGLIALPDEKEKERLENDAFYRLEHGLEDVKKAESRVASIQEIKEFNDQYYKDPFTVSQILRKKFRTQKKNQLEIKRGNDEVKDRLNLSIDILPSNPQDSMKAKEINWLGIHWLILRAYN